MFDIELCPLPFSMEEMFGFISCRFTGYPSSVQEQALLWLHVSGWYFWSFWAVVPDLWTLGARVEGQGVPAEFINPYVCWGLSVDKELICIDNYISNISSYSCELLIKDNFMQYYYWVHSSFWSLCIFPSRDTKSRIAVLWGSNKSFDILNMFLYLGRLRATDLRNSSWCSLSLEWIAFLSPLKFN